MGLAAALSSPIPEHPIDYSAPGPDSQRINQLAADPVRLESMMAAARDLAKTRNKEVKPFPLGSSFAWRFQT
jgi:hypothetical protein